MYNRIADEIISLKEKRDDIDDEGLTFSEKQQTPEKVRSAIRLVSDGFIKFVGDKPGSLYKVELAPKENEYLLYDKTVGEQTKDIQNKVRKVLKELKGEDLWEYYRDLDYRDITDNALENVPEP